MDCIYKYCTLLLTDFYREFLENSHENPNMANLSSTLSITEQIDKLTQGLEMISNELQSQVREQHSALLSQVQYIYMSTFVEKN